MDMNRLTTGLVDLRIQRRIVVHLHLAIGFVLFPASEDVVQQLLERPGQIGVLLFAQGDATQLLFADARRRHRSFQLLTIVIQPQRHDREPIDRAARRLGVDRRLAAG